MTEYLTMPKLAQRYGRCGRTIARWREKGFFPEPDTYFADRIPAWRRETVDKADEEKRLNPPAYGNMEAVRDGLAAKLVKAGVKSPRALAKAGKAKKIATPRKPMRPAPRGR